VDGLAASRPFSANPFRISDVALAGAHPQLVLVPDEPRVALAAVVDGPHGPFTVVATHLSLYRSLAAAEELAPEGIECEVIDPVSLFPLDTETLWASVRKTGRLVIVHEDTLSGGWGAEVAARAADECLFSLEAPIKRVATYDTPLPFAPIMEAAVTPSVERIVSVARSICA
jgi:pyruvate dehydrogenase E1 component beta subunit